MWTTGNFPSVPSCDVVVMSQLAQITFGPHFSISFHIDCVHHNCDTVLSTAQKRYSREICLEHHMVIFATFIRLAMQLHAID